MKAARANTAFAKRRKIHRIYELRVELEHIEPVVWRQLSAPGNLTLAGLDRVIQAAMGWTNSHLHEFEIGGQRYGEHDPDLVAETNDVLDGASVTLDDLLGTSVKSFAYLYDFGDHWAHRVRVEGLHAPDEELNVWPMCLAGANACPPEDVGSVLGYADFLAAMSDPEHEEHRDTWLWAGGPFDPRGFDINAANRAIRACMQASMRRP